MRPPPMVSEAVEAVQTGGEGEAGPSRCDGAAGDVTKKAGRAAAVCWI